MTLKKSLAYVLFAEAISNEASDRQKTKHILHIRKNVIFWVFFFKKISEIYVIFFFKFSCQDLVPVIVKINHKIIIYQVDSLIKA